MGKVKELSEIFPQKVIEFHKSDKSYGKISERLSIPISPFFHRVIKKFNNLYSTKTLPERGRKSKLSTTIAHKICWGVKTNPRVVLIDIDESTKYQCY